MRIRAIVFDDEKVIRTFLRQVLQKRGYEVFTFPEPDLCPLHHKGGCGCTKGQACTDIIISDINMPNVTGLQFVENQLNKGCKVKHMALMSGAWSNSDLERAEQLGCHTFHKPIRLNDLEQFLDQCEKEIDPHRILSDRWFVDGYKKAS